MFFFAVEVFAELSCLIGKFFCLWGTSYFSTAFAPRSHARYITYADSLTKDSRNAGICETGPTVYSLIWEDFANSLTSSETQGRLAGARGNKSSKEMKRRRFTSKTEKAPGNRLLSDHFQTALPMLPPDWAEKSSVLFCPIGEQQLLRYCGVFLHDHFRIAILAWFVRQCSACDGNFHFFP